jgi:uncharacterized membrane protein YccC
MCLLAFMLLFAILIYTIIYYLIIPTERLEKPVFFDFAYERFIEFVFIVLKLRVKLGIGPPAFFRESARQAMDILATFISSRVAVDFITEYR